MKNQETIQLRKVFYFQLNFTLKFHCSTKREGEKYHGVHAPHHTARDSNIPTFQHQLIESKELPLPNITNNYHTSGFQFFFSVVLLALFTGCFPSSHTKGSGRISKWDWWGRGV
mmetsp:Transcript_33336/g.65496  ORF Transcript_33336/g.65496 Transcript_33336/m.65496 type:complete len:114 (-) Transcript_33336:361-702(-)